MSLDIVSIPSNAMSTFKSILAKELKYHQTEVHILFTGKTGQGKSSLLNSILELKAKEIQLLVKEGDLADRCTNTVTHYSCPNATESVSIELFDSPGLQDCTGKEDDYILELDQKCGEVNLALICRKMTEYRLTPDDELALKKLKSAFGNEFWRHVVFIFTFANTEDLSKRSELDKDCREDEPDSDDEDAWEELEKKRFKYRVEARGEEIKKFIIKEVEVTPEIVEKIPFIPAGYHKKARKNPFIYQDTWLHDLLEKCTHQMKTELGLAKLNLKNSFNLAIIINNDNEEPEESSQEKKTGKDDKVPIPPAIVISKQSEVIREKLEGLGFGVLYFSNLTTEGIHQLLEAFAQAHHDDLTSFTLVVLSKGSEPFIHDADGQVVPFEKIFEHFSKGKIADIPKSFFFHLAQTDPPNDLAPFFVPKKSVGFIVACQQTKEEVSPAVNIYVEEMEKCYTTCVGRVFQKMETTIEKQPNTKCKLQNSFEQDVTLPNCYKPSSAKAKAVYLHKRLQLYHSMWWKIRNETATEVIKCIEEVLKLLKGTRITKIISAALSLLAGGGLTVAGLALIPFTAGGSTALTIAGAGVVATSAVAGISATIVQSVKSNATLKEVQKHINLDQQLSYDINIALHEYKTAVIEKVQEDIRNDITKIGIAAGAIGGAVVEGTAIAVGSGAGGTRVGGLVADVVAQSVAGTGMIGARVAGNAAVAAAKPIGQAVSGAVEAGAAAGRLASTGLRVAGGTAALVISVPMDIYQIVDCSIALASKSEEDAVHQWIMGQIEYLIKGLGHSITEVSKTIKGKEKILLDIEDKYGFQMKNGIFDQKEKEECDVSVHIMYAGPFAVPEGATLASAIYDIKEQKKLKLKEPVTVKIQHCIEIREKLDPKEQVCFAIATLDKETNRFEFKPVDMKCSFDANYGYIELQELNCLICILHYKGKCYYDQIKYTALCSYSRVIRNYWKLDIITVKQLAAHITYVQTTNGNLLAFPFKFHGKQFIELEEPPKDEEDEKIKGAHKVGGWLIIPCEKNKKIEREDIDNLEIQEQHKQWKEFQLPFFQLDIAVVDEGADPVLKYRLPLKGTTSSVTITCEYEK